MGVLQSGQLLKNPLVQLYPFAVISRESVWGLAKKGGT